MGVDVHERTRSRLGTGKANDVAYELQHHGVDALVDPAARGLRWENVPRTARATPSRIETPGTVDGLLAVVRTAVAHGQQVRPVGSARSASTLAVAPDVLVDLRGLRGLVSVDPRRGTATFLAGTTLGEAAASLEAFDVELIAAPADAASTIGGAISVGAHGTAPRESSLSSQLTEVQLVTADGSLITCSPRQRAEAWDAVRLSLGALGIIATATLRIRPVTVLSTRRIRHSLDELVAQLPEARAKLDTYQLEWRPGSDEAVATIGWRSLRGGPALESPEPVESPRRRWRDRLRDRVVRALPFMAPVVDRVSTAIAGVAGGATPADDARIPYLTYQFPLTRAGVVVAGLRDLFRSDRDLVGATVRATMVAGESAWMSAAYGRDVLAVTVSMPRATAEAFSRIENRCLALGGLPEWSGFETVRGPELAFVMPRYSDFAHTVAAFDPDGRFRNPALERILHR